MAYIDYSYYTNTFGGDVIPESEFDYMAARASDIVDLLVMKPVGSVTDSIKKAVAYEAETLFAQGGIDAVTGMGTTTSGITESLGDYRISTPYVSNEKRTYSVGGTPVSGFTLGILVREGLMSRCVFSERSDG